MLTQSPPPLHLVSPIKRHARKTPSQAVGKALTKTFTTGGSQAVRLPKAFRLNASTIQIERNAAGQIILTEVDDNAETKRLAAFAQLVQMIQENPLPADFLPHNSGEQESNTLQELQKLHEPRNPFEEWASPLPALQSLAPAALTQAKALDQVNVGNAAPNAYKTHKENKENKENKASKEQR